MPKLLILCLLGGFVTVLQHTVLPLIQPNQHTTNHSKTITPLLSPAEHVHPTAPAPPTNLQQALDRRDFTAAQELLSNGADPNFSSHDSVPSLEYYAAFDEFDSFALLIASGANANQTAKNGTPLLQQLLDQHQYDFASLLIDHDAQINRISLRNEALLHALASSQSPELHDLFWKILKNPTYQSQITLSIPQLLQRTLEHEDLSIFKYLIERHPTQAQFVYWQVLKKQNTDALAHILPHLNDIDEKTPRMHNTPLVEMMLANKLPAVQLLLEHGANPNAISHLGQSPIVLAILDQNYPMAKLLLKHSKTSVALNQHVKQPVNAAFLKRYKLKGMLRYYLRSERDITPLMLSAMTSQLDMTKLLLKHGANKNARTRFGKTYPIQIAAKTRNVPLQQLLLGVPHEDEKQQRKIVIQLKKQKILFYKNGQLVKSSKCSSGKKNFRTPKGTFVITDKHKLRLSNLYNQAKMPFFQRLSCTAVGLHEGYVGRRFASHGCIRLPRATAAYLFKHTRVGDRVTIQD